MDERPQLERSSDVRLVRLPMASMAADESDELVSVSDRSVGSEASTVRSMPCSSLPVRASIASNHVRSASVVTPSGSVKSVMAHSSLDMIVSPALLPSTSRTASSSAASTKATGSSTRPTV